MPNVRRTRAARPMPPYKRRRLVRQAQQGLTAEAWSVIRDRVNDYAMWFTDAANHQSASKADIAHAAALSALQKVRRAIEAALAATHHQSVNRHA